MVHISLLRHLKRSKAKAIKFDKYLVIQASILVQKEE